MMADSYNVTNIIEHSITDFFTQNFSTIGHFSGRVFKLIQDIPNHMQQNRTTAFAVFVVSNAVFFTLANFVADKLNYRIERHHSELDIYEKNAKHFILSGFVGLTVAALNLGFDKFLRYPLSKTALTAVTVFSFAAHFFLSRAKDSNSIKIEKTDSIKEYDDQNIDHEDNQTNTRLMNEVATLKSQLEDARNRLNKVQVEDIRSSLDQFKSEINTLKDQLKNAENRANQVETIRQSLEETRAEKARLEADLALAQNALQAKTEESERTLNEKISEKESVENAFREAQIAIQTRNNEIETLMATLAEAQQQNQTQREGLEKALQEKILEKESIENSLNNAQNQIEELNTEIAALKAELAEMKEQETQNSSKVSTPEAQTPPNTPNEEENTSTALSPEKNISNSTNGKKKKKK